MTRRGAPPILPARTGLVSMPRRSAALAVNVNRLTSAPLTCSTLAGSGAPASASTGCWVQAESWRPTTNSPIATRAHLLRCIEPPLGGRPEPQVEGGDDEQAEQGGGDQAAEDDHGHR